MDTLFLLCASMLTTLDRPEHDREADSPRIPISHCSERDFLDTFRGDLANCTEQVMILSPFLSQNRAIYYYPVLHALTARAVRVDVYSRPRHEQPDSLREHYGSVEHGLTRAGVHFHIRPGMHEKIAILDSRILWHGSLNILSHSDTRESMLRIESSDLVHEVLADLGLGLFSSLSSDESVTPAGMQEGGAADITTTADAPQCPQCGHAMLLFENAGMWICRSSPRCSGTLPQEEAEAVVQTSTRQETGLACPLCGALMEMDRGAFPRIVCSSLECRYALDPRLSAGLIRILNRRRPA